MATWPINELSGLLDPDVFVLGYYPTGVDVGAEISQVLNKINDVIVGANELKVDLTAEEDAGEVRDALIAGNVTAIQFVADASSDNTNAVSDLEDADVVLTDAIAQNVNDIGTNSNSIAVLNAAAGLGTYAVDGDTTLDYATYSAYNGFELVSSTQKDTITLPTAGGSSWPRDITIRLICASSYGAIVTSAHFRPDYTVDDIQVEYGDILECRVVPIGSSDKWMPVLLPTALKKAQVYELSVTETYAPSPYFFFDKFMVSGQGSGNVATVTLPKITDNMIGMEIKGFRIGTNGTLRFARTGTDVILQAVSGDATQVDLGASPAYSVATLTALPSVSSVYRWGCSIDSA